MTCYTFTGTDWSSQEEQAFASIQAVSRLTRIEAIQLWKRHKRNTLKATRIAKEQYPPYTEQQKATYAQAAIKRLETIRRTK